MQKEQDGACGHERADGSTSKTGQPIWRKANASPAAVAARSDAALRGVVDSNGQGVPDISLGPDLSRPKRPSLVSKGRPMRKHLHIAKEIDNVSRSHAARAPSGSFSKPLSPEDSSNHGAATQPVLWHHVVGGVPGNHNGEREAGPEAGTPNFAGPLARDNAPQESSSTQQEQLRPPPPGSETTRPRLRFHGVERVPEGYIGEQEVVREARTRYFPRSIPLARGSPPQKSLLTQQKHLQPSDLDSEMTSSQSSPLHRYVSTLVKSREAVDVRSRNKDMPIPKEQNLELDDLEREGLEPASRDDAQANQLQPTDGFGQQLILSSVLDKEVPVPSRSPALSSHWQQYLDAALEVATDESNELQSEPEPELLLRDIKSTKYFRGLSDESKQAALLRRLLTGTGDMIWETTKEQVVQSEQMVESDGDEELLCTYTWAGAESRKAAIHVPGAAPLLHPQVGLPFKLTVAPSAPIVLNADVLRSPTQPFGPLFAALLRSGARGALHGMDVLSDEYSLTRLLAAMGRRLGPGSFRIDVALVRGALVLTRSRADDDLPGLRAAGGGGAAAANPSYPLRPAVRAAIITPARGLRSAGQHVRAIRYQLGGLRVVVRQEVFAVKRGLDPKLYKPNCRSSGSSEPESPPPTIRSTALPRVLLYGDADAATAPVGLAVRSVGGPEVAATMERLWLTRTPWLADAICAGEVLRRLNVRNMKQQFTWWERRDEPQCRLRRLTGFLQRLRRLAEHQPGGRCAVVRWEKEKGGEGEAKGPKLRILVRDGNGAEVDGLPDDLLDYLFQETSSGKAKAATLPPASEIPEYMWEDEADG